MSDTKKLSEIKSIVIPADVKKIMKNLPNDVKDRILACTIIQYLKNAEGEFNAKELDVDSSIWLYFHMEQAGRKINMK